jgi:hypothetical protein
MMRIESVVALAGPYDIDRHFQFEAARRVKNSSPTSMLPACGGKHQFHRHSPALQLSRYLSLCTREEICLIDSHFPRIAFFHGLIDDTVPMDSSQRAAQQLRAAGITKCDEFYYPQLGHAEIILELMFGGKAQDNVIQWIEEKARQQKQRNDVAHHLDKVQQFQRNKEQAATKSR